MSSGGGMSLLARAARWLPPPHPVLIGLFPVLSLWAANRSEVPTSAVTGPLAVTAAGVLGLFVVLRILLGDHRRAAAAASGLAFLFFAYGHARELAGGASADPPLLVGWLVAAGLVLFAASRLGAAVSATRILNVTGVVLVTAALIPVGSEALSRPTNFRPGSSAAGHAEPAVGGTPTRIPDRDIWYLVFDRYARDDTLRHSFGYDNTPFLHYLEGTGFEVADRSLANYPKTAHSVAASLNMSYLDHLRDQAGPSSENWQPVYRMLADHALGRFLTHHGYRYVHVGPWFAPLATSPWADITYHYGTPSEFAQRLVHTTVWPALRNVVGLSGDDEDYRTFAGRSMLYQLDVLDRLAAASQDGQPTFVFAEITLPHAPFVMDADGRWLSPEEEAAQPRRDRYLGQLRYANRRVRRLVDQLLDGPTASHPIVIVQSDEGPNPPRHEADIPNFVWPEATDAELAEKFRILNAYYLPGLDRSPVYDTITPVNSFRVVLDAYFGTRLGLLPDRAVAFYDEHHLYDFSEVTARLRRLERHPPAAAGSAEGGDRQGVGVAPHPAAPSTAERSPATSSATRSGAPAGSPSPTARTSAEPTITPSA